MEGEEILDDNENLLSVSSADILRLIMAYLTENGLHESVKALRKESGVGMAASLTSTWYQNAMNGQWASILRGLAVLDKDRAHIEPSIIAAVHEQAILELAEQGEWDAAYALFRFFQQEEDMVSCKSELDTRTTSIGRSLEHKLAVLAASREKDPKCTVVEDYYGKRDEGNNDLSIAEYKQQRREQIGMKLQNTIPIQPQKRLPTLLQQAIKWQSYTGQLPRIKKWWEEDTNNVKQSIDNNEHSKKRKYEKIFDIVLGEVSVDMNVVGTETIMSSKKSKRKPIKQDIATIKFGKKALCQSALFLPDGSGIVTGSSDGWIEVWDNVGKLRTDLTYQEKDELLGHENGAAITALAITNDTTLLASGATDGIINVWNISTGKCLRKIETVTSIVSLTFSIDGSHILAACKDGTCREYGLRTAKMLKEFSGHTSYLTHCSYALIPSSNEDDEDEDNVTNMLVVVTASGDGTVRIWNGKTADLLRILQPVSFGKHCSKVNTSIVTSDATSTGATDRPVIHTILPIHTPKNTFVLVPRGICAFLVTYHGTIVQTFHDDTDKNETVFVAGTVGSTNRWLYLIKENGVCCIFDLTTGKLEKSITDFGSITTYDSEISNVSSHPSKELIAAFSTDKGQKKGRVVLWK